MLTKQQYQTYQFIRNYILEFQQAPTEREIAVAIGIRSRGVVHRYVHSLVDKGLLKIIPDKRRNIVLAHSINQSSLPMLGKIAAGTPIEAISEHQTFNYFDRFIGPNRFLLRVKGDSMLGDHICDGDLVVCEQRDAILPNDIVVVLIDQQETTLKRIQTRDDDSIALIPSNPQSQIRVYPSDRITLQGVMVGLLRLA